MDEKTCASCGKGGTETKLTECSTCKTWYCPGECFTLHPRVTESKK